MCLPTQPIMIVARNKRVSVTACDSTIRKRDLDIVYCKYDGVGNICNIVARVCWLFTTLSRWCSVLFNSHHPSDYSIPTHRRYNKRDKQTQCSWNTREWIPIRYFPLHFVYLSADWAHDADNNKDGHHHTLCAELHFSVLSTPNSCHCKAAVQLNCIYLKKWTF